MCYNGRMSVHTEPQLELQPTDPIPVPADPMSEGFFEIPSPSGHDLDAEKESVVSAVAHLVEWGGDSITAVDDAFNRNGMLTNEAVPTSHKSNKVRNIESFTEQLRAFEVAYGKMHALCDDLYGSAAKGEKSQAAKYLEGMWDKAIMSAWRNRWSQLELMIKRTFSVVTPVAESGTPWAHLGGVPSANRYRKRLGVPLAKVKPAYDERIEGAKDTALSRAYHLREMLGCVDRDDGETERHTEDEIAERRRLTVEAGIMLNGVYRGITAMLSKGSKETAKDVEEAYRGLLEAIEQARRSIKSDTIQISDGTTISNLMNVPDEAITALSDAVERVNSLLPGKDISPSHACAEKLMDKSGVTAKASTEDIVDRLCYEMMNGVLTELAGELSGSLVRPNRVTETGLGKSTAVNEGRKRRTRGVTAPSVSEVESSVDELVIESIDFPENLTPWLKDEERMGRPVILHGKEVGRKVLVVDTRSEKAKQIEKMSSLPRGYIEGRLQLAAEQIMTSHDGKLSRMSMLRHRSDEIPFPIHYWSARGSNSPRVYISQVSIEAFVKEDPRTYESLKQGGVHSLVLLIGACDKGHQQGNGGLLELLTD